jgi:hypothetical protein
MSSQTIGNSPGKRDEFLAAEINRFVREFQAIGVRVTPENAKERIFAFVHPPYMLQSVTLIDNGAKFEQLKEQHRARLQRVRKAREIASEAVRRFLDRQFYEKNGRERLIASGRAELAETKELLQKAVDRGLVSISRGKKYPDGYDLRRWLKKYGVGIDCSGFVQQALRRLIEVSRAEVGKVADRESELDKGFLRCEWVYKNITGGARYGEQAFVEVSIPTKARPGDVVVSRSHMRIVVNVDVVKDGGIVFEVAESTSARDIPSGQTKEEADIGPRIIQVKYPKPNEPIAKQSPLKNRLVDDAFEEDRAESEYVIGRCREIEQLWSNT